jgi:hypothetical protein
MRVASLFVSIFLLFQQAPPPTATPPQLDPQAETLLSQMATATGWTSIPTDAVATGTITRAADGLPSPFTLKARSCTTFRLDVSGTESTVVNGNSAATTKTDGTHSIPGLTAMSLRPMAMPFFCLTSLLQSGSYYSFYAGPQIISGQQTYRIELASSPISPQTVEKVRSTGTVTTIWLSASTFLPVQISSTIRAASNPSATATLQYTLSDYRVAGNLKMPFHQEATIGARSLYSLQLSSADFNVGLTDPEFAVPATAQVQ